MTFKIGAAFGSSGGNSSYSVVNSTGELLATGTTRSGGGASAVVEGVAGDEVYVVLADGREAGPVVLDHPVSEAVAAIEEVAAGASVEELLGILRGNGSFLFNPLVTTGEGAPLSGAVVTVRNGSNIMVQGVTDATGRVRFGELYGFALESAAYTVLVRATRFEAFAPQSLVLTGDAAPTYELVAQTLPVAASPDLVTVFGRYGFLDVFEAGVPVTATIRGHGNAFLNGVLQNQEKVRGTTTAAGGTWSLELAPLPASHFWELAVGTKKIKLSVPNSPGESVDVETLEA